MPPKAMPAFATDIAEKQEETVFNGIENYEIQKKTVQRIVREALPANIKLAKDVVPAISKSTTVFINYLAATAHDVAVDRGVKTIAAQDVLKAIKEADFFPNELLPILNEELEAYRTAQAGPPPKKQPRKSSDATARPSTAAAIKGSSTRGKDRTTTAAKENDAAEEDEREDEEDAEEDEEDAEEDEEDEEEGEDLEGEEEESDEAGESGAEEEEGAQMPVPPPKSRGRK